MSVFKELLYNYNIATSYEYAITIESTLDKGGEYYFTGIRLEKNLSEDQSYTVDADYLIPASYNQADEMLVLF